MDIEAMVSETPEKVVKSPIDARLGLPAFQAREIAKNIGYSGQQFSELGKNFERLYAACVDYDAELIEMNPLVETSDGKFMGADARIIVDDNALFRHPE